MTRPALPPRIRSRAALGLTSAASQQRFVLQHCSACGHSQFPPQEFCGTCLSARQVWRECTPIGTVVAEATLHHSLEPAFTDEIPLRTGLVQHETGCVLTAFLHPDCTVDAPVRLSLTLDRGGSAVVTATPAEKDEPMGRCSYSPKDRVCLITDGAGPLGDALEATLVKAGAAKVLTRPAECEEADIVIDTSWLAGDLADLGAHAVRAQALADRLGPGLAQRQGAWVSVLGFAAIAPYPACPEHSARMAAAQALTVALRARLNALGGGVLAVYPAFTEETLACGVEGQPLSPEKLSQALVSALESGQEESFPDPSSRLWVERLAGDRKSLERELAFVVG